MAEAHDGMIATGDFPVEPVSYVERGRRYCGPLWISRGLLSVEGDGRGGELPEEGDLN